MSTREELIADALLELSDALVEDFEVSNLLHRLVDHALELLDADAAGIMLADSSGTLQVVASNSHAVELLELYELQVGSGPCLDCFRTGQPVTPPDLATVRAWWPDFAPRVEAAGYASAQAVPMRLRDEVIGAFNIFRTREGALVDRDLRLARALADVATVALITDRTLTARQLVASQLQGALSSRVLLEQAKGMLAERAGISVDRAFTVMRDHARRHGRGLREVAGDVVSGRGLLPTSTHPSTHPGT
ncbi:GAF domain-containing protein [Modestobacter marinus]|uniref:GAF domain-containing protein n=1 Tax=Modestobacter marinus TaxID=477641 RepID=A0A846LVD3_9ACTN|nr:GAF and ANTAR domain-containing protein [Modestobacter marinus]NIH70332.1 GAF domain-containing protein [Modestobacter marinus]GGL83634.1 GAF domain-containing protein [Modestobacter marinus]